MKFKAFLVVVASSVVLGCGGSGTDASVSLVGTWKLTSVNGSSLPVTLQAANPKIEVLSDQVIFASAGTFTQTGNYRITSSGTVSNQPITDTGTWTQSGTAVTVHNSDNSTLTGSQIGTVFTIVLTPNSFVYTKQ